MKDIDPETVEILRKAAEEAKEILKDIERERLLRRLPVVERPENVQHDA